MIDIASAQVAADGGNSRVKALSGVGSWGWDYDQRGLVCAIETSEAHTTAWQRFLSTGPLAMLPVRRYRLPCSGLPARDAGVVAMAC